MTCLAPFALFGVLLLALPIVVHLFKPRKMKQTPFSSLRWLKQTHQRLSRRIQWHQWLLFLVRAACILLLVIALAKPLLGGRGSGSSVDRFIIVDTSRSMAYRPADGPTPMERASEFASQLAKNGRPGDRTAAFAVDGAPRLLTPPEADAESALPILKSLKASAAEATLSAALPIVRSQIGRDKDRPVELFFVTDNLAQRWRQEDIHSFFDDLPNPVRVTIVQANAGQGHNAWIADARLLQFGDGEDRWIRCDISCNSESSVQRSVRMTGVHGLADETQAVTLKPGQLTRVAFRVPPGVELPGQAAELRLEPLDSLPSDDVFHVNLDLAGALRIVVIEPESLAPDGRPVGLFLHTALKALADSKYHALDVTARTPATILENDLKRAEVILFAGAPDLPDAILEVIETHVRAGAGLALFLGPQLKGDFANQKLHRAAQPTEGVLPVPIKDVAIHPTGKPLINVRWTHPLLASLRDPLLSDFTQCRFQAFATLGGTPRAGTVLASFDDDTPAIVEQTLGAGRVLVLNTSANDEWGDLPRRKSYLPFVDRLIGYLSTTTAQRTFSAGDGVTLPLASDMAKHAVTVTSPSGAVVPSRIITQRGQTVLHLDAVLDIGAYRVSGAGKNDVVFVVNAPRTDSPMNTMDRTVLEQWWSPAPVDFIQEVGEQASTWPMWPALVLLAGILLIVETVYVHLLCPKADPRTADAVVTRRGVLKPVSQEAFSQEA